MSSTFGRRTGFLGAFMATALALMSSGAFAQASLGGIAGSGPAQSTIVIENEELGISRSVRSDSDGRFLVTALPGGRYKVTLTVSGKAPDVRSVVVAAGTNVAVRFDVSAALEEIVVTAGRRGSVLLDTSTAETSTVFSLEDIAELPVSRSITNVALLAPGTTLGDGAFGNLASFSGSSVAENAYYINGFNITNFRNGLGASSIPFEAYQDFQVKTGGYSAEFGRSTGGVISTTTKRGTNEWQFGVNVFTTPEQGRSKLPDTYDANGDLYGFRSKDESSSWDTSVSVGGPIIKDRLFVYGIYQLRNSESDNFGVTSYNKAKNDDPFWLGKVDWQISDNHLLELTAFSDKRTTVSTGFVYDAETNVIGDSTGDSFDFSGGRNYIAKYSGVFGENLTVSALYGKGEYDLTTKSAADACPWAYDSRPNAALVFYIGCWASSVASTASDEREAYRFDVEWRLGDHRLRFGYDREDNLSLDDTSYSGGIYYRYYRRAAGFTLPNGAKVPGATGTTTEVVRARVYSVGGSFGVESDGLYLEDNWQITPDILVQLGARSESFTNLNSAGEPFIEIENQIAPRLGLSWDVQGDGSSKLFASAGRYYLPIASNTNVRLAGGETFNERYYTFSSIDPVTAAPSGLAELGSAIVYSDGEIPDPRTVVDQEIDPQYQDEFIVGFERRLNDNWTGGVRAIYRDLKSSIEDIIINPMLLNKYDYFDSAAHYILTNPGKPLTYSWDIDDDGDLDPVSFTGSETGYPEAERTYLAAEVYFEKAFSDNWYLRGSYTWSHNYGNSEGYVRSDNGQDDAGITTQFDFPALAIGASGDLPNDRRHQIKLFGAYRLGPTVRLSANALIQSGRPENCFGYAPIDPSLPGGAGFQASTYGAEAFYCNGKLAPRGSLGNLPWTYNLDFGVEWRPARFDDALSVKMDIFNVFDEQTVTAVIEQSESGGPGATTPDYRLPRGFQSPRAVRVGVSYNFSL